MKLPHNLRSALCALSIAFAAALTPATASSETLTGVTKIVSGDEHTCVLMQAGHVKCWGSSVFQRLGWNFQSGFEALDVVALGPVNTISAGYRHTCAANSTEVRCWGENSGGQLGVPDDESSASGIEVVPGLPGIVALAAGGRHTCGLTSSGGVKCWGLNANGELGNGNTTKSASPVNVTGLTSGVTGIAASYGASCALTSTGGVKCWGSNGSGELGDGTNSPRSLAADVSGLTSGVTAIAGGFNHFCAIVAGGAVKCWGANDTGQLGDGSTTARTTPVDATGLADVNALALSSTHSCATIAGGAMKCWGSNAWGQLGDNTLNDSAVPIDAATAGGNVALPSAGGRFSCALAANATVKCWGANVVFELGNGFSTRIGVSNTALNSGVVKLDAGTRFGCALMSNGGVKCWGDNTYGAMGDGTYRRRDLPVDVTALGTDIVAISLGGNHACALTTGGGVKCWGSNVQGQLGNDSQATSSTTPVDVTGLSSGVISIGSGGAHTCAVLSTGALKCWGWNEKGQLGNNTTVNSRVPIDVTGLSSGVASVAGGFWHTCAVLTDGSSRCWGYNAFGMLGDTTTTDRLTPVSVIGIPASVAEMVLGTNHTCARTVPGAMYCWGQNLSGQLGTQTSGAAVAQVVGLSSGVNAIFAGSHHTCAILTGNELKCWGRNSSSQATGGSSNVTTPAAIWSGVPFAAVGTGATHTCAATNNGVMFCWGDQAYGALANGNFGGSKSATQVLAFDMAPAGLNFPAQTNVARSSVRTSQPLVVSGLQTSGTIWVENGTYTTSCNPVPGAGATYSFPNEVYNGLTICVRHTSSGNVGESVTTTLYVSGVPFTFTSTTGDMYALTVGKSGNGAGTVTSSPAGINCGTTCSADYATDTPVTLTPTPNLGSSFVGWSGACTGSGACVVTMSAAREVFATFMPPQTLTVMRAGAGNGIVTNAEINCPGTCSAVYNAGTMVTVTATAGPGSKFQSWANCSSTQGNVCTVHLVGSHTVQATFVREAERADMNGDGWSDVVWYHTGVFGLIATPANGLSLGAAYAIDVQPDANWKVAGIADLNGDGRADVVWRNEATGEVYGLLMDGPTILAEGPIYVEPNLNWTIEQIADLNGNGRADLVWKNQATGEVYVMLMNGLSITSGQVVYAEPNLDWKIVASGDMNGDGRADLLWRNQVTGDVFAMLMNGFMVVSGGVIYNEPNLNWKVIGLADFNGDNRADVLWQNNATGDVFLMQMNGTLVSAGQVIYNEPNTQWKIVALGDYNRDGMSDILWQNTATGQVYMMLMNSFAIASGGFVYTEPDTQWRIIGP